MNVPGKQRAYDSRTPAADDDDLNVGTIFLEKSFFLGNPDAPARRAD
jgi:hypothetical protein